MRSSSTVELLTILLTIVHLTRRKAIIFNQSDIYNSTYKRNHNARPHFFLLSPRALQNSHCII